MMIGTNIWSRGTFYFFGGTWCIISPTILLVSNAELKENSKIVRYNFVDLIKLSFLTKSIKKVGGIMLFPKSQLEKFGRGIFQKMAF